MMVGETCVFESETYRDERTGAAVKRLTSPAYRSHHQYFYLNMWMPDGRAVLVASNRGDGVYRHYLLDVGTGEGLCLTDDEKISTHFAELAGDGKSMLYSAGAELRRLDLPGLSEATVYRQPDPWTGRSVYYGATADHARAVMMEIHRDDAIEAKEGWDAFVPQFQARPRCRLVELDVAGGAGRVIHEDRCWLGHPNYRPDGRTIMFCHEGPWELVRSRVWFVDPDGSNLREGRKRRRPPGPGAELWGHEYWLADSSRAAYVYFPREYGREATVRLLDPDTLVEEVLMPVSSYSHFISNRDNSLIVADGHVPLDEAIYLLDTRARSERVLCRHGSSNKPYVNPRTGRPNTQEVHPHPCFSPDSRKVLFSSDRHGGPAVYVVAVPAP